MSPCADVPCMAVGTDRRRDWGLVRWARRRTSGGGPAEARAFDSVSVDPGTPEHCLYIRCDLDQVLIRHRDRRCVDQVLGNQVQLCRCIGLLLEQDRDRCGLGDSSQLERTQPRVDFFHFHLSHLPGVQVEESGFCFGKGGHVIECAGGLSFLCGGVVPLMCGTSTSVVVLQTGTFQYKTTVLRL